MKQKILNIIAMLSFMVSSVGAQTITMQEFEYSSSVLGHKTITVKIADAAETTAVQMNLSLPEGYALTEEGIALSDAINDHIISVSPLASGDYLIVVYSLSQSTFKDGTLLVIPLSVDANAKNDEAVLHTMRTSTADAVSHVCTDTKCLLVAIPVLQIAVNPKTAILVEGETLELTSSVRPADATNQERTWSSSDENIATVDNKGLVTAITEGTATITVMAGGKEATCVVTVEKKIISVTGITLNQNEATLVEGESLTLTATVAPDNATDKTVVWSTSDAAIATVDNGVVTAVAAGTATITAKAGDKEATCVVTVKSRVLDGIDQLTMDNGRWTIYDLQGRKVENPAKGIYIINGRKVVIK